MEIQNTLENKAKFFAQYWGQEVLRFDIVDEKSPQSRNAVIDFCLYPEFREYNSWTLSHSYILLTPLSQITDEELKPIYPHGVKAFFTYYGSKERAIDILTYECDRNEADFLRSKGFAFPWLDTTVEQQIEYGWVKLKQIQP